MELYLNDIRDSELLTGRILGCLGRGRPRNSNCVLLDPIFFHSEGKLGGSSIRLGTGMKEDGGGCPGNAFPSKPLNSGRRNFATK